MEEDVPVNVFVIYSNPNEVIDYVKELTGVNSNTIILSSPGIEIFTTIGEFYSVIILNSQVGAEFISYLPVYVIFDKKKINEVSEELLYSLLTRHMSMNIVINEVNYVDKKVVNEVIKPLINEFTISSNTPITIIEEKLITIYPDGSKRVQSKSEVSNSEVTSRLMELLISKKSQSKSDSMKTYF